MSNQGDQRDTLALELDLARRIYRLGADTRDALLELVQKAERGAVKYGPLDMATDRRDFEAEAREELLDAVWYLSFSLRRVKNDNRLLRSELAKSKAPPTVLISFDQIEDT